MLKPATVRLFVAITTQGKPMQQKFDELQILTNDQIALVRQLVEQVPGLELVGFKQPESVWTVNSQGWELFGTAHLSPNSFEAIDWVTEICKHEQIQDVF